MPESGNGSVGAISLDLTVNDKLTEQINRIATAARGPAERIGRELEQSIEAPMRNVGTETGSALNEAVRRATENASSTITNRMNEIASEIREKLSTIDFPSGSAEQFTEKLDIIAEKLSLIQKKWQEISTADPFSSAAERAEALERRLTELERRLHSVGRTEQDTVPTPAQPVNQPRPVPTRTTPSSNPSNSSDGMGAADVLNGLSGGAGGIAGLIGTAVSGNPAIGAAVGSVTNSVLGTVSKAFSKVSNLINKLTGNAAAKLKEITVQLIDVTRPLKKMASLLLNALKGFAVATVLYGGWKAFKEGVLEAANANEQFSGSLKNIKANLGTAFMPVIQQVLPILNALAARLEQTTKQVAGFTAKLFGMTYTEAANAYKKLKATADQAKKTKAAVAGIDELNILSDGEDENGANSFDTSEPVLPDWAERLKDSLRSGDWEGAGKLIAQKFNDMLAAVDWNSIQAKAKSKVDALVGIINGFAEEIDPALIGENIAGAINTITGTINGFADGIKWTTIGKKLAQGLNKAIRKIDWSQLGRALTAGIRILTDTLYGFSTDFDFKEFGLKLSVGLNAAVNSIDTLKLGKALSNIVRGALQAASAFLSNADFKKIGEKIAGFFNSIDVAGITADGAKVMLQIWQGIIDIANSFLEKTDFFKIGEDFINGLFDGGAAAAEDGTSGQGLISGFSKLAVNLNDAFVELLGGVILSSGSMYKKHLVQPFIAKLGEAFGVKNRVASEAVTIGGSIVGGIISGASDKFEKVRQTFTELRGDIEDVFDDISSWFGDRFSEARSSVESKFSSIGTWFTDRRTDITEVFSNISTWFSDTFRGARSSIEKKFDSIGTWFSDTFGDAWEKIKSAFSLEKISIFFGQSAGGIKSAFDSIGGWFETTFSNAYDSIANVWDDLPQLFWDTWTRIEEGAVNGLNNILDVIENFVNKASSGFNSITGTSALLKKAFGGAFAGGHISIPRLAAGGYATAPTLAMIGDNPHARTDPEVVSPLSKLQGMMSGDNTEVVELLRVIVELLRNGISAELIGSMFGNDFKRTVLRIVAEDSARRG